MAGEELLAGPFHPAFRQKVESRIFGKVLDILLADGRVGKVHINPLDEAAFFGFRGENAAKLKAMGLDAKRDVIRDPGTRRGWVMVEKDEITIIFDRKKIAKSLSGNL
jgi:hypothetical protein